MRLQLPPLHALKAFDAAARQLSFTRAGEAIGVTHGAISHQIRSLEAHLGTALFERLGNRLRLTPEGEALAAQVRAAFEILTGAAASLPKSNVRGEVAISVPPGLSCLWLTYEIPSFLARYPDITLRLVPSNEVRELHSADIDLWIRYGTGAWPDRHVELLSEVYLFPVCSPQLLNASPQLRRPDQWWTAPLLCADDGYEWDVWLAGTGQLRRPAKRHYLGNALMAVEMCVSGFGVALGDNIITSRYLADGRLVRPFDVSVKVAESFFLVTRQGAKDKPAIMLLSDWIRERFSAMADEWAGLARAVPALAPTRVADMEHGAEQNG
jgi:LysR family glycine cleavage system transcriptional activator